MSFDAPGERDFDNVASLNSAYLELLGSERALGRGLAAHAPREGNLDVAVRESQEEGPSAVLEAR